MELTGERVCDTTDTLSRYEDRGRERGIKRMRNDRDVRQAPHEQLKVNRPRV